MNITAGQFIDKVTNEDVKVSQHELKLTAKLSTAKIEDAVDKMLADVQEAVDSGYLAESILIITGLKVEISFALQTGIINLPWQDTKKVTHFFEMDDSVSLKSYLVTFSDWINVSHLRIDEVASDASAVDGAKSIVVQMISDNLAMALENKANQKEGAEDGDK